MDVTDETVRPRLAPGVRMRFDTARDQHVLLLPEAVLVLNATGAAIIELCDGTRTVPEVESGLRERFADVPDGEVASFVAQLLSRNGLEVRDG